MEPTQATLMRLVICEGIYDHTTRCVDVALNGAVLTIPISEEVDLSRPPRLILEVPICPPSPPTNPTNTPSS